MYAIFLDREDDEFNIRSLGKEMIPNARIESVELLGHVGELKVDQKGNALVIQSPSRKPHNYAYAFKIKLAGDVGNKMVAGQPFTMAEESMT